MSTLNVGTIKSGSKMVLYISNSSTVEKGIINAWAILMENILEQVLMYSIT